MKIFFYINVLSGGGAERVIANLANQFTAAGEKVSVITTYATPNEYYLTENVGRFQLEDAPLDASFIVKNIHRVRKLRRILKKEKPDILVSFMAEPNYRAVFATKGLKTKLVVSVRNDPNKEYAGKLGRVLGQKLLPMADGCVFQTEDAKLWFPQKLQDKSCIIMNQVAEVFYSVPQCDERKNIVTVGRLTDQKNHEMLIRAFARIAEDIEDDLIIYGEGKLREKLEYTIAELGMTDRIFLPGATKDVPNTIKNAKLFVLSSDYEGMPNALMEAMAIGLPCISTDCPCGGPKMLLEDDAYGVLTPVNDEVALSEKMNRLLSDHQALSRYAEAAKTKAEEFKPQKIFSKWNDYIVSVINR